jgi:hypothetical protein
MARDRAGRWVLLLLAAGVGALGLLPHAVFSAEAGRLTYFKSAYDEDTYTLWALLGGGPAVPGRWLSTAALRLLFEITGRSWDATLVAADVVFPVCAALCCWLLAGLVTRQPLFRSLAVLSVLFSQEFLSLGCSAVWDFQSSRWNLAHLRAAVDAWKRGLVPDYYTSFFSLYRTPEPQVSLSLFFLLLWLLAASVVPAREGPRPRRFVLLLGLNLSLGLGSVFVAAAVVAMELLLSAVLALRGRLAEAARTAALGAAGALSVFFGVVSAAAKGPVPGALMFRSRLPVITPSTLTAAACLIVVAFSLKRTEGAGAPLEMAVACFGAVLVLTNQQIVTGWMVSTKEWERYVDYSLVVLGLILCASVWKEAVFRTPSVRVRSAAGLLFAVVVYVLVRGQLRVLRNFVVLNRASLAMESAVEQARRAIAGGARLLLDEPALAPLLQVRANRRLPCQLDYTEVFVRPIPVMSDPNGAWGARSPFKERLFEYFARTGRSPADVARLLDQEAEQRSGFFLGFLFSLKDSWYPLTDDRDVRQKEIRVALPDIVRDYARYLGSSPEAWKESVIRLTSAPKAGSGTNRWDERELAHATFGTGADAVRVYALLQTPLQGLAENARVE